ncbi:sugar-binding domain-containing protein [Lactococcus lactis]|uniref:Citrate lyase transcriptional regulator CitI n=1 Tax=Lactococcus lactis subsp. lactis TaxID=1360 RepID=A0A0V8E9N1_LACLL|nr:sugar-binding transcriptional regulator [Lactococcus lactis]KSU22186.1 Citrate lyase transcriptional regulator CitI [Lactococcus lactis subsp. lactis]WDA67709.1 sugar-binding transcriptional regulator [Lactococcus lactis]
MNNHELLANLAQDFYFLQLSLSELSEKYHLSRYLVNKYLEDARKEGIVTITISSPIERSFELEKQFKTLFDIPQIYIIKDVEDGNSESLIKFAAKRIESHILNSQTVGTVWGETIFRIIDYFTPQEHSDLVFTQMMGENRKYHSAAGSMRMVEKAAKQFSAQYVTLSGPLYITNPAVRKGMTEEIASQPAFTTAKRMDLIFSGLGTLASVNSIPIWEQHTNEIFPDINLGAIAGMAYGRPYDINGNILVTPENDCVFGVDMKTIFQTPKRVGVVKSKFKTQATLGALRGKFFTELIISESIAERILAEL